MPSAVCRCESEWHKASCETSVTWVPTDIANGLWEHCTDMDFFRQQICMRRMSRHFTEAECADLEDVQMSTLFVKFTRVCFALPRK